MKLTTPKAILIGSIIVALAIIMRVDDALIPEAQAEVAGMDHYDLKYDWDFKRAVQDIVEDCDVYDEAISC